MSEVAVLAKWIASRAEWEGEGLVSKAAVGTSAAAARRCAVGGRAATTAAIAALPSWPAGIAASEFAVAVATLAAAASSADAAGAVGGRPATGVERKMGRDSSGLECVR